MTIKDIIAAYLKANGFDGLCDPDGPCGCNIDDLFACESYSQIYIDCHPAYKHECPVHGAIYGPDKENGKCAYCGEDE